MNTCKAKPWKNLGLVINSRRYVFQSCIRWVPLEFNYTVLRCLRHNHVIAKLATDQSGLQRCKISLVDAMGTRFTKDVKIVGLDPDNDLAVLKIETEGRELKPVALGTSSDLCVGQSCLTCLLSLKLWRIISRLMTVTTKVGLSSRACLMFMAT
ncbi:hypothetical protein F2Q68_00003210 [Brassica cretica]|uniref:Uncharacterized protein n=2 Tax=Brassica cretica TaxID=69181 RepID=A0ABQ7C2N4_BRACR|nr:hypothetical protein F2Q68_00003210 [Brassica cretica]KAF3545802.1 hypothetical protein DY000_02004605 [Brassica cretica]